MVNVYKAYFSCSIINHLRLRYINWNSFIILQLTIQKLYYRIQYNIEERLSIVFLIIKNGNLVNSFYLVLQPLSDFRESKQLLSDAKGCDPIKLN